MSEERPTMGIYNGVIIWHTNREGYFCWGSPWSDIPATTETRGPPPAPAGPV